MSKPTTKEIDSEIRKNLLSDSERTELFLQKNWKKLIAAAILVVAVVGIASATHSYLEKRAGDQYSALVNASTVAELRSAIAAADRGAETDAARLRLAKQLAAEKKFPEALKIYAAIASDGDAVFAAEAKLLGAYTQELSGDLKGAAQSFSRLSGDVKLSADQRCEAAYAAARLTATSGELKKALAIAERGKKNTASPYWQNQCRRLASAIKGGEYGVLK